MIIRPLWVIAHIKFLTTSLLRGSSRYFVVRLKHFSNFEHILSFARVARGFSEFFRLLTTHPPTITNVNCEPPFNKFVHTKQHLVAYLNIKELNSSLYRYCDELARGWKIENHQKSISFLNWISWICDWNFCQLRKYHQIFRWEITTFNYGIFS